MVWFQYCSYKIASLSILNQNFEPGLSETGELAKDAQIIPSSGFSMAKWVFGEIDLKSLVVVGTKRLNSLH
jgi:hypothetical protein